MLALQLAPSHRSARLGRARVQEAAGQLAGAIADCEIYLQLEPDAPPALLMLARVLTEAGVTRDLKRARDVIGRVLDVEAKNVVTFQPGKEMEEKVRKFAKAIEPKAKTRKAAKPEPVAVAAPVAPTVQEPAPVPDTAS